MQIKVESEWTVGDLIELQREKFLRVNHEYQRGLRWTDIQKRMFIDSIFRGYSIPAFYLHKHETFAGPMKNPNTYYDIVDGQQRIDAIYSYSEGNFTLLDPSNDSGFRFPNFVKEDPCPWGGKRFDELSEELKDKLKNHKIVVYEITTENENSIRDLFIRLQGGTPLNAQDKRDSWPGNFTEFVLKVGGKKGVPKWPGHPLFIEIPKGNESRRRQLMAQIYMLFWTVKKEHTFCEIKSANIDEFYHSQVAFVENSDEARRFEKKICETLHKALSGKPKVTGHHLIHLFLLVDSFLDEYVPGTWESNLAGKLNVFEERCREAAKADKERRETEHHRYYTEYARWTQTRTDSADTIRRRHAFFTEEMLKLLSPKKLDGKRALNEHERKTVFFRDRELCQYCRMNEGNDHKVLWEECDIHHVIPHKDGGATSIENAALVHRDCHPRGEQAVREFRTWWGSKGPYSGDSTSPEPNRGRRSKVEGRAFPPPEGTKARFRYGDRLYTGEIRDEKLVVSGSRYKTFSEASRGVTDTSRNGWRDWYLLLPDDAEWILADEWRNWD